MKILWAVFGERNGGHALLVASANVEIAAKITQYTDRPGDPPLGLEWGPVTSGFFFADYYIILRTLPDPTAGRAGMVRSYAAFLPVGELASFGNLSVVFKELSSDLSKPPSPLPPLNVDEEALRTQHTGEIFPGLTYIAKQLCSANPVLPLVWSSADSYLPIVDVVWATLPVSLRTAFAFSFQFAPEHKLPVPPTIVATLPALATRWPSTQIIPLDQQNTAQLNTAQKWFAGLADGKEFNEVLRDYGMVVREFKELNVLSSFADLIVRLPQLSFAEARKAIRILEKYSKPTSTSAKKRTLLFEKLCALVLEASPEEIETLRNFNPEALADLIPLLQDSMIKWINASAKETDSPAKYVKLLELAIAEPDSWWGAPFTGWLRNLAIPLTLPESCILCRIAFASTTVTDFISAHLPFTSATEERILAGMPGELSKKQSETILRLSKQRNWMRLHATCLLRTLSESEAIASHVKAMDQSTAGLDLLFEKLGFVPLLRVACELDNVALADYVGRLLPSNCTGLPQDFSTDSPRWPVLLSHAIGHAGNSLTDSLRELVTSALSTPTKHIDARRILCEACCAHGVIVFLKMQKPAAVLGSLAANERARIVSRINAFVISEIRSGRKIDVNNPADFRELLDVAGILNAIRAIPVNDAATVGVNAFRSLRFLTDSECTGWLIDLFTRTQNHPLDATAAEAIGSLLLSGHYPSSAKIVRDTVEQYNRNDAAPILAAIRYKYEMAKEYRSQSKAKNARLPKVLIATALPLERNEVMEHLGPFEYHPDLYADVAYWPSDEPIFEIYVVATGPGNLDALRATLRILSHIKPKIAFFLGVSGGVKDSDVGDVVYSTKVYYTEGGKEETDGVKARPVSEHTDEALVQLAHRMAKTKWQPVGLGGDKKPQATPAIVASGEKVLASIAADAANYQRLKTSYNDTQVVDMEGFGFLMAFRDHDVRHRMVIRGVSDKLQNKAESDAKGNQLLAARNASAFLFALLRACPGLLRQKKKALSTVKSVFVDIFSDPNALP